MTTTLDDEVMARDVHPAEVLMPDGSIIAGCRVFVTSHRMVAWVNRGGHLEVAAELELAEPTSVPADRGTLNGNARLEIRTATGTAWVNRGRGCGCGSPLKALDHPVPWTRRSNLR